MRVGSGIVTCSLSACILLVGCATAGGGTSGGSSSSQSSYQTQRMMQNLTVSIEDLTQSTASLGSRMDSTEQQVSRLVGIAEENQRKLDNLQFSLDQLTTTLYQQLNLSPPVRVNVPPQPGRTPGTIPQQPQTGIEPTAPQSSTGPQITPPAIAPPDSDVEMTPSLGDPQEHYRAAQEYYSNEDYVNALKQFDAHVTDFPQSPHTANATYWRAQCLLKIGDYSEAVQGFEDFRATYGSSGKVPIAMHNQAVAYSRLGQAERAKALFQQLIREYPDDVATEGARRNLRQLQGLSR